MFQNICLIFVPSYITNYGTILKTEVIAKLFAKLVDVFAQSVFPVPYTKLKIKFTVQQKQKIFSGLDIAYEYSAIEVAPIISCLLEVFCGDNNIFFREIARLQPVRQNSDHSLLTNNHKLPEVTEKDVYHSIKGYLVMTNCTAAYTFC